MKLRKENIKEYKKGAVLLTEKPFAFVLKGKLKSERCDYCFKRTNLFKCSGCSFVHYCDQECQKKGWKYHKIECPNIKRVSPQVVPDAARLIARIIIRLEKGGAHERSFYTQTNFRVFKDLMSHYNEIKDDTQRMEHITSLAAVLNEYLGKQRIPNTAELLGIYGRMVVNTFNILDSEMQSIGSGIYLAASVIDHSCAPNAVAVFEGTKIVIRTLKNLPTVDWLKVYISYIDLLNTPEKRQKELQSTYYFLCQCSRCLDVEELGYMTSSVCQNADCKACILGGARKKGTACPKCTETVSTETWEEITEISQFTEQQLDSMKDVAYLDVCRICLKKQEGLLHELNINRVKVLDLGMESCIELGNWECALQYGQQLLEPFKKYYGELHPLRGIFLMKLGKIALFLEKINEARIWLKEAASILFVTHGENHPLIREELLQYMQQCQSK